MGEYSPDRLDEASRTRVVRAIRDMVSARDVSPGIHSAGVWLLRKWHQKVAFPAVPINKTENRTWWVDSEGHTMLVLPTNPSFTMGSPPAEEQRVVPMTKRLAVSMCEVTVGQFRRYRTEHTVDGTVCPFEECPVTVTSWYDAVQYCRWLTAKEGLPESEMVYPPLDKLDLTKLHQPRVKMPQELLNLSKERLKRKGYRLPTSAEWEYLCRAGMQSRFCFGENALRVGQFAWMSLTPGGKYRTHRVGTLRPNAWGICDVAGNVAEWAHDRSPATIANAAVSKNEFFLRGGIYRGGVRTMRSARVITYAPQSRYSFTGFRLVRTLGQ